MTICLGKNCSFRLMCVSFVNVCQFMCVLFPLDFKGEMWNFIVLVPDHCLSFLLCS